VNPGSSGRRSASSSTAAALPSSDGNGRRAFRDRVLQLSPLVDQLVEVSVGAEKPAAVDVPVQLLSGEAVA